MGMVIILIALIVTGLLIPMLQFLFGSLSSTQQGEDFLFLRIFQTTQCLFASTTPLLFAHGLMTVSGTMNLTTVWRTTTTNFIMQLRFIFQSS